MNKLRRNFTVPGVPVEAEGLDFKADHDIDPRQLPPWYEQFQKLSDGQRKSVIAKIMEGLKKSKPDAYDFIKKFDAELVGLMPNVAYVLPDSSKEDPSATWIHAFGARTLLFWCKQGGFGFFVNPNLDYNDTVLNKLDGNKKEDINGFTG